MARACSRIVAINVVGVAALVWSVGNAAARDYPASWVNEWPRTDFNASTIPLSEIRSAMRKDGIPAIGKPRTISVGEADHLGAREPAIGVVVEGEARVYPLQLLMWPMRWISPLPIKHFTPTPPFTTDRHIVQRTACLCLPGRITMIAFPNNERITMIAT